ncbi:MAG: hypothetical protein LBG99_03110 [Propionibacteriaceae bacterium]|jgi:hypothetical protein|nr:hypothetical protein [Propionibacteriaceae bacterium]
MDRPRFFTPRVLVDVGAILLIMSAALVGFWPAFGSFGFLRPALVGMAVGLVIAWVGAWKRWPTIIVAAVTVGAYFVFGAAGALWTRAIAGVVPDLDCLRILVFGSVGIWKQFVTVSTPLGSFFGMTLVPFILALLVAVGAGTAAWRAKRIWLVFIPLGLLAALVILFGTARSYMPIPQALVMAGVSLAWIAWRSDSNQLMVSEASTAAVRRSKTLKAGIQLVIGALVAGCLGIFVISDLDREALRRHVVPPLDTHAYPSPLISFRDLVDDRAEEVLFIIDGWDKDYLLRLAVMDTYDGMVYNVGAATGASHHFPCGLCIALRHT